MLGLFTWAYQARESETPRNPKPETLVRCQGSTQGAPGRVSPASRHGLSISASISTICKTSAGCISIACRCKPPSDKFRDCNLQRSVPSLHHLSFSSSPISANLQSWTIHRKPPNPIRHNTATQLKNVKHHSTMQHLWLFFKHLELQ